VPRHNRLRIRFQTLTGETEERLAGGYHASLLQHECDHLDGFLYPMRMTDLGDLVFASELGVEGLFYRYSPQEFDG
jgi:peptide deformylase